MLTSHNILKSNVVLIMTDGQSARQPEVDHVTTLLLVSIEKYGEVRVLESRTQSQTKGSSFWKLLANDFDHFSQITHVAIVLNVQTEVPHTDHAPLHRSQIRYFPSDDIAEATNWLRTA